MKPHAVFCLYFYLSCYIFYIAQAKQPILRNLQGTSTRIRHNCNVWVSSKDLLASPLHFCIPPKPIDKNMSVWRSAILLSMLLLPHNVFGYLVCRMTVQPNKYINPCHSTTKIQTQWISIGFCIVSPSIQHGIHGRLRESHSMRHTKKKPFRLNILSERDWCRLNSGIKTHYSLCACDWRYLEKMIYDTSITDEPTRQKSITRREKK